MVMVKIRVSVRVAVCDVTFSVWTECTVPNGNTEALATRMAVLQAEQRRETQWHPRVQFVVENMHHTCVCAAVKAALPTARQP
jgi:hypothetical protein